ncbi:MAG TPA: DUF1707 domain-containing protein [Streptosporangiaceae bacterium]
MATGSRGPAAAGWPDRGRYRASDADREQVLDAVKAAYVLGRLTKDELDLRAGQALAARTYADLAVVTADIPPGQARYLEVPAPRPPARQPARKPVSKKAIAWSACAIAAPPLLGAAFFTYYGGFIVLFLLAFIGVTVTSQP